MTSFDCHRPWGSGVLTTPACRREAAPDRPRGRQSRARREGARWAPPPDAPLANMAPGYLSGCVCWGALHGIPPHGPEESCLGKATRPSVGQGAVSQDSGQRSASSAQASRAHQQRAPTLRARSQGRRHAAARGTLGLVVPARRKPRPAPDPRVP